MRTELAYTEGYWWHKKESDFYFRNALLGDWDSADNYEQVTDAEYEAAQQSDITPEEALEIITGGAE